MIIEAGLTLVLVYLVHFFVATYIMRRKMPPGPFPFPVFGNFPHLLCDPIVPFDKLADKYGDIYTLSFPNDVKTVILNTAKLAREAKLGTQESLAGKDPKSLYPWKDILGNGSLLVADYSPELKFRRRVFKLAMHVYGTERAATVTGHTVEIVNKEIEKKEGQLFSPGDIFESAIIVQLWEWITSEKVEVNDPIVKELSLFIQVFSKHEKLAMVNQVIPFFKYLPFHANREIQEAKKFRNRIFLKEYNAHIETYTPGNIRDLTDSFISCHEQNSDKRTYKHTGSTDDIAGLMADVAVAGSGTTSSALTWFVIYMVLNPNIQENIRRELYAVLGDRLPCWKDAQAMPYLQATLCEVQRASGMIMLAGTTAVQDTTIAGYHVPKGATVVVNFSKIHHDAREWPEPEKFKPERFLDSDGKFVGWNKLHGFLPFSVGRRECAGQSLAKIMMFTLASALLYHYKLELPEGGQIPSVEDFEPGIIKRLKDYKIIAKKRKILD